MRTNIATPILAILALGLAGAVLTGTQISIVSDYRTGFIALAIIGFTMCAVGPLREFAISGDWLSWGGILGVLLGILGLALIGAVVVDVDLPIALDDRQAFIGLAAIVVAKLSIGILHRMGARAADPVRNLRTR